MQKVMKLPDSPVSGLPVTRDFLFPFRFCQVMLGIGIFLTLTLSAVAQEPPVAEIVPEEPLQEEAIPEKVEPPPPPKTGVDIARHANATSLGNPAIDGVKVLILGDSMALSGYADTLDDCFRSCPGVSSVHTVICCGTNPLSWLKAAPYSSAKTRCGFLEKTTTADGVKEERDIYGMKKGHKPSPHVIPKIEDLVSSLKPDIIVFQCGNNFFDLFSRGKPVTEKSGIVMRAHVTPLVKWLTTSAPSVKKWYWVTPPEAGNVTPEVQSFIFDTIKEGVNGYAVMLDSREITSYPYPMQDRDRMHFWGQACNDWGRDTFRLIAKDLAGVEVAELPSLVSIAAERALAAPPIPAPIETATVASEKIRLRAKLVATSTAPAKEKLTTYGEYLVVYLYDVIEVKSGQYSDKQLLLLHPAYIKKEPQDLSHFKVGEIYEMEVEELEDISLWATTRRSSENDNPDLVPHMLINDRARHPDAQMKSEPHAILPTPTP
jgi:hypothetical protein